jgi:hypothetical protein
MNKIERDDDSKKSHPALVNAGAHEHRGCGCLQPRFQMRFRKELKHQPKFVAAHLPVKNLLTFVLNITGSVFGQRESGSGDSRTC